MDSSERAAATQDTSGWRQGQRGTPLAGAKVVPIDLVQRDPQQPRRDWRSNNGYQRLEDLTKSIREFGILQPLVVREEGDHYIVIAGGRRLVAARRAGLSEIPVIVRGDDDAAHVRVLQLIENLQRHDLTPTDEARAFQALIDLQGMTPPQIALRVHVSEQYVRDRLRVLRDEILSDAVERGQIAMSVAREITKLADTAASLLRQRVEAGESVQMSDIRAMRHYLREAGIVNPRLSPRADRTVRVTEPMVGTESEREDPTSPLPETDNEALLSPGDKPIDFPTWPKASSQNRSSRSIAAALKQIEQDYQRYRATSPTDLAPATTKQASHEQASLPIANPSFPLSSPMAGRTTGCDRRANGPDQTDASRREATHALHELLAGLDSSRLEQLLYFAIERGWTVAGLLQVIQRRGPLS